MEIRVNMGSAGGGGGGGAVSTRHCPTAARRRTATQRGAVVGLDAELTVMHQIRKAEVRPDLVAACQVDLGVWPKVRLATVGEKVCSWRGRAGEDVKARL
ncbi:hypothetical protein ACP70R_048412 [Stipagrostis hirtigluma subsp. patula]